MNENEIRDYISSRLHLVEDGLELVDKEHYLKNDHGASGFLDIFARSKTGQLVIIEIKRTNSAAREAIQELYRINLKMQA
ncbi:endonuclease NucS domain-containing protein [Vibrio hyugaensis]|uniref:endonuclease NucS domain-containing protein n=1 Tax=Vibrio hyugaensis TaxID=1534743 RepID=UPI000CE2ED96|nr:endonuclease NucS domain-containing protein [Vibrio hyugaensis]